MKNLGAILLITLISPLSWSAGEPAGADFEKSKQELVAEIDEKIAKLNEHKSCVAGAANLEALKACRAEMREFRHEQKMERLEKRKSRIEERMNKAKEKHESSGK